MRDMDNLCEPCDIIGTALLIGGLLDLAVIVGIVIWRHRAKKETSD